MTTAPSLDPATRRGFLRALSALPVLAAARVAAESSAPAATVHADAAAIPGMEELRHGDERIVILLYPGFTAMDAMGPEYMLSGMMGATVRFIAKTTDPVKTESGFHVVPQLDFAHCPEKPTLVLVPGGATGTLNALEDKETLAFLRDVAPRSTWMGSVCTGSLLLGAAGLLRGVEATSHWQTLELLPLCGAIPSKHRVVYDQNRVTAAGVTAGLDLGLSLVRRFRGDFYAKGTQLLAQYDPQPVFANEGNPETADPKVVNLLEAMHQPFVDRMGDVIKKLAAANP